MEYDVVIVGAGPAGLTTAIKLKQLDPNLNVCILEKGSEVGAHILSGNVFETKALDELIPNWRNEGAPVKTKVSKEKFLFLGKNSSLSWPTWLLPSVQKNHRNYIISLANLCRWLAEQAEKLGVEIFPGFPASEVLYNEDVKIVKPFDNVIIPSNSEYEKVKSIVVEAVSGDPLELIDRTLYQNEFN